MITKIIENVKMKAPLIHNITNYVTVNDCANILLASGASPIMADDETEVEEITSICDGLVINLGTLNQRTISSMHLALKRANELCRPVVLDPVGAGASVLRTDTALSLLHNGEFAVIRGNISEIKTLNNGIGSTQGVDANIDDVVTEENLEEIVDFAIKMSKNFQSIIAISGKIDIIADSSECYVVRNGNKMMSKITGSGCMLSALVGAYLSANPENTLKACAVAFVHMGISGELAYEKVTLNGEGTGSFRTYMLDYIHVLTAEEVEKRSKYVLWNQTSDDFRHKKLLRSDMKLYAVTDRAWLAKSQLADQVEAAVKGGATFVQLREKALSYEAFIKEARSVKAITDHYHIPFVINDNVDVAIAVGADGVHIGQGDEDIAIVRARLGGNKIIGVSVQTAEQALAAERAGADYIGVGAMFGTTTKLDAKDVSIVELKRIAKSVNIPVVAIGGINSLNVVELKDTGIDGVAVVSAIFAKDDIYQAAKELLELVQIL